MSIASPESDAPIHRFILLTDIAQSSRLTEQYPREYLSALAQHDKLVEQAVDRNGGEVYKHTGDGYMVLFETAGACLNAALELGEQLEQIAPLTIDEQLKVRLVLHGGDLQPAGRDYFGPALNRASRVCQVCNPGQVLMSAAIAACVGGAEGPEHSILAANPERRPGGFQLRDLGLHYLRDLAEPEHLYQLDGERFVHREYPPLSTLNNRPNNLVMQPNAFIGRQRELAELAAMLLDDIRLLSIVAPGGYGKTRVAAQLCANLLHRFERGVFMAYLAPLRDSALITTAIANALGFHFSGSREPLDQLCDYLRQKELLLCLDNCEHLPECAPVVKQLLDDAPRLKIVVTSREPLRLNAERICRLEPLALTAQAEDGGESHAEAVLLFADRAALVNPDFAFTEYNAKLVQDICVELSGIPLAIELAAAWMDSFTLSELRAELSQQLELEARTSDKPARHQSLKASLDWSWNLLGSKQQEMLMRLSTFRSGFFAVTASTMLGLDGLMLRKALSRLADKSWLYKRTVDEQSRFYMRDLLAREFVFEKLRESELRESATMAHARHFSDLMMREGPRFRGDGTPEGQAAAVRNVQLELDNINEAFDNLQERLGAHGSSAEEPPAGSTRETDAAALLTPIARWLATYLDMTSSYQAMLVRYEALRAVTSRLTGQTRLRMRATLCCGQARARLGEIDGARQDLADVIKLASEIGDPDMVSSAQVMLGNVELHQGNYDAAREQYNGALETRREAADPVGVSYILNNVGLVEYMQGNYRAARELYAESLAAKRKNCDRFGIGASLGNLGLVELRQGNYGAAREHYEESLTIRRESGDRRGIATALVNLGLVEYQQGTYCKALELLGESLAINREIGDPGGISYSLEKLGCTQFMQGRRKQARQHFEESLAIRREIGHRRGRAESLVSLGIMEALSGKSKAALECYTESLVIRHEIGDRSGLCEGIGVAGSFLAATKQLASACICYYGARYHATQLSLNFAPMERSQINRGWDLIKNPASGLPPAERELLKNQAEAMSLVELSEFTLAELNKLKTALRDKAELPADASNLG